MMKKLMLSSCGIAVLIAAALYIQKLDNRKNNMPTPSRLQQEKVSVREYVQNNFLQEELHLWNDIEQETGITKETCLQLANKQRPQFVRSLQKKQSRVSSATQKVINNQLSLWNLDPKAIVLVQAPNSDCGASATIQALYIDENYLQKCSQNIQEYLIGHEVVHLVFDDPGIQHAFRTKLKEQGLYSQKQNLVNKLSRFCERRADTLAFTQGDSHIEGGLSLLNYQKTTYGEHATAPTHPSFNERIALANEVQNLLKTRNQSI